MDKQGIKIPSKLQRFLRMVGMRNGITQVKVAALILREGKLALSGDGLPCADVYNWDIDQALDELALKLGADRFEAVRYVSYYDCCGVRNLAFEVEVADTELQDVRFVAIDSLDMAETEKRDVIGVLKKMKTKD